MKYERMRWWHLPQLREIEATSFGVDAWSEAMFWSELAEENTRQYWIAYDNAEIVGYAGLCVYGTHAPRDAWVQTIAVAPARRRQGVAQNLLNRLTAEACARDASLLSLEVREDNEPAQLFYARSGFEAIARREGYYAGGALDAIILQKPLKDLCA